MGGVHFCTMFIGPYIGDFLCQRASKGDLKLAYSAVGDPLIDRRKQMLSLQSTGKFYDKYLAGFNFGVSLLQTF
ncbi:hypothetical protein [Peribacillus huizhouensis]|uniref:Uncharacterized protein n=1 Tax=Peribacillus huizhouensis TaxID=1501239 RepID=A0ABR6CM55_9BACI|nr:hypothetical protein [Peribacillus huizhouensis]MBA9026107.1 hypothetical protein [Peribacillus huizhouensis]